MEKTHAVRLGHDQKKEWESQVTGLSFKDAVIIKRLVAISMKLADGDTSSELVEEASKLSEEFLESDLSHILLLTFGDRVGFYETHEISPEVGHG